MTSCHCPISVICLVCKGEDLTPRYLVLACEPFVSAGAGRETLCELARIAVRRESRRTNGVCSATCVSHTPAAACRRCWPSCARPSSSYERCPCLQFAPAGHTAQEPGRRSAAQHGRARSGVDSSLAGPLRARPWAGRRCAGVLARSWRECTARARQQEATTSARVVVRHGKVRTEACSFASFSGSTGILGGGTRRGFCARRPHAVLGCGNSTSSKTRKPTSVGGLPKDDLSFVTRSVREERREGMDNLFGLRPDQQVCAAPLRAATLCDLCVCPTCACVATLCVPGE